MGSWQTYLDSHRDGAIEDLVDFLRIPSISALPQHADDVIAAANWVAERLAQAGMEHTAVMPTGGHPVVYADWLHAPDAPTIMIYGHFDVQPVDPIDEWEHPPFEPAIDGDRIYARGASDDKGNLLAPILALEAMLCAKGALPLNVKCLFEGQEEIGSPQLGTFVEAHASMLACDAILNADAGQFSATQPAMGMALRGLCALQIDLDGPNSDLHSGSYGGAVQNPIHALIKLLDAMRGDDGRILVEGFYDDVLPLTPKDRQDIAAVPWDEQAYMDDLGVDALWGESGFTPRERAWGRPTLEINGITGGFQGEGTKTVLPRKASCKITCRLVSDQDGEKVVEAITAFVHAHCPPGVRATVTSFGSGAKPYHVPSDLPVVRTISEVLREMYGRDPLYTRNGGSIGTCAILLDVLGAYTISFGFGLPDERYHAPNEFYRLSSFFRGQTAYCMALEALGA